MITATEIKNQGQATLTKVEDQNRKSILIASSKVESSYLSPRQLVQSALAGCLSMTVRRELENNGIVYNDVTVHVDMKEESDRIKFLFEIIIDSDEDKENIDTIKKQAINDCYILGLLSDGIEIEQAHLNHIVPDNQVFDRCCD